MAFRNPVRSLPASSITGQIVGTQIAPNSITTGHLRVDALDGRLITGSTIRTAAAGTRLELDPDGVIRMFSGATAETAPGQLTTGITSDGSSMSYGYLTLRPPVHGSWPAPEFVMALDAEGGRQWHLGPLYLAEDDTQQTSGASIVGDFTVTGGDFNAFSDATVDGVFKAGNIRVGHSTVTTTAANTPASLTVSGLNLTGTAFRALATANTTVPGTQFTGVATTSASANSFILWATRTNTGSSSTGIDWIALGV